MITVERKKERQRSLVKEMRKKHIKDYGSQQDLICSKPYCEGRVTKLKYNKAGLCTLCLEQYEVLRLKFWRFNAAGEAYNAVLTRREIMDTFHVDPAKHKEL